jgi:hypothetical protein
MEEHVESSVEKFEPSHSSRTLMQVPNKLCETSATIRD